MHTPKCRKIFGTKSFVMRSILCVCCPNPSFTLHMIALTSKIYQYFMFQLNQPRSILSRRKSYYTNGSANADSFPCAHFGMAARHPNDSIPTKKLFILILQIVTAGVGAGAADESDHCLPLPHVGAPNHPLLHCFLYLLPVPLSFH